MLPKILFVRHGETDWNREGRMQGQRDIPLNERGRRQAMRNGRILSKIVAGSEWEVAVSPLGRARETLQIILETGVRAGPVVPEGSLKEIAYGAFEGLTPREIREHFPDLMKERSADRWNFTVPGGESYAELSGRVWAWLETLQAPTLIVAHGGVMRVILRRVGDLPPGSVSAIRTPQNRVLAMTGTTTAFL